MKKLYINASPRWDYSYSKVLADYIDQKIDWETKYIDLIWEYVPFLTNEMLAYNYSYIWEDDLSEEGKTNIASQNKFIEDLLEADVLIISVPMWNFSMPAVLKAYFDLIAKAQVTFKIGENGFEGLVKNIKKSYVVWARGGKFIWTEIESMDFLSPEINTMLSFLWIENNKSFWLEWTAMMQKEALQEEIDRLKEDIDKVL